MGEKGLKKGIEWKRNEQKKERQGEARQENCGRKRKGVNLIKVRWNLKRHHAQTTVSNLV